MRALEFLAGVVLAAFLAVPASAQDLPAEVAEAYLAYERAFDAEDWASAALAAQQAAEAADAAGIGSDIRSVLWENTASAFARSQAYQSSEWAYERSFPLALESGDVDAALRLVHAMLSISLATGELSRVSAHIAIFERLLPEATSPDPGMEADILALALSLDLPLALKRADELSEQDQARLARLELLSLPGSTGDITARRLRIVEHGVRAEWGQALDGLVDAYRSLPDNHDTRAAASASLFAVFHELIAAGFGDFDSAGDAHLPADVAAAWCAHLSENAYRTDSGLFDLRFLGRSRDAARLDLEFEVDAWGRATDISMEIDGVPAGESASLALSGVMETWRWRPQCSPTESFIVSDTYTIMIGSDRQANRLGQISVPARSGRLFVYNTMGGRW
ncbi:MAG: hypothetical protein CMF74_01060 [Maricaulis sp.]|jgi:hypothetical protein|nr:hypothetical protein [Maricaulis sp.]